MDMTDPFRRLRVCCASGRQCQQRDRTGGWWTGEAAQVQENGMREDSRKRLEDDGTLKIRRLAQLAEEEERNSLRWWRES